MREMGRREIEGERLTSFFFIVDLVGTPRFSSSSFSSAEAKTREEKS